MADYECECLVAGFCKRHKAVKQVREWELCRGINCNESIRRQYQQFWDMKAGLVAKPPRLAQEQMFEVVYRQTLNNYPPLGHQPFTREPTRNLVMHVWPTKNGAWQWNLDRIIERIHLFNGKRIIGIVTDGNTDSEEAVQEYVTGHRFEFLIFPNQPKIAEMVTFIPSLELVASDNPNDMTFRCHAKGSKHNNFGGEHHAVKRWAEAMYETCLDDLQAVEDSLESYALAGAFKRHTGLGVPWHFSGSFYWMRHVPIFQRNWRFTVNQYAGVELWPGKICSTNEAACLFHNNAGNVYDLNEWSKRIQPELEQWRNARFIHATND